MPSHKVHIRKFTPALETAGKTSRRGNGSVRDSAYGTNSSGKQRKRNQVPKSETFGKDKAGK